MQPTGFIGRLALALVAGWVGLRGVQAAAPGSSIRSGPATWRPGQVVVLTNQLAPLSAVSLYTLSETVPVGWAVKNVSDGGSYNPVQNRIHWLFLDDVVRQVTFTLQAPAAGGGLVAFQGEASFDGQSVVVGGLTQLTPPPPLSGVVVRRLPLAFKTGATLTVVLAVAPEAGVSVYGVEEVVPEGWTVRSVGSGGTQPRPRMLQWGPFLDDAARELAYAVQAPTTAAGEALFQGSGAFDSAVVEVGGATTVAPAPPGEGSVRRVLPVAYRAGVAFTVALQVRPGPDTEVHAVSETPPAGWRVTNISDLGGIPAGGGAIRWGPFLDHLERTLTYQVTPPAGAREEAAFIGLGEFDGVAVPTGGTTNVAWVPAESGVVTRVLPETCRPGGAVWVTNLVTPNAQVTAYGLEELLPPDWVVADPGLGSYQAASGRLRFGPFLDHDTRIGLPVDGASRRRWDGCVRRDGELRPGIDADWWDLEPGGPRAAAGHGQPVVACGLSARGGLWGDQLGGARGGRGAVRGRGGHPGGVGGRQHQRGWGLQR